MPCSLLPSEIISHIASFLPTASCLRNLALTCRFLYHVISAEDYRVFRAFIQGRFPGIDITSLWKDAARALTSRSRALDRNAITARYVLPPQSAKRIGEAKTVRRDRPTLGYRPAIDSYEAWYGGSWFDRKEVLAWGAGAELIIRTTDFAHVGLEPTGRGGREKLRQSGTRWIIFNDLQGVDSWDDICGVHLLPPAQMTKFSSNEEVILGRRNGRMVRMSVSPEHGSSSIDKFYRTAEDKLECTDMSPGPGRVLAATMGSRSVAFYRADAEGDVVEPFATLNPSRYGFPKKSCSKLLSGDQVGVSAGDANNKISIFALTPDDVANIRNIDASGVNNQLHQKARITVLEPLSTTSSASGTPAQLFLSGWEDSSVRLHDQRSPQPYVTSFLDTVDHSPTYCIHPIGRERFLTGAGENALVKMFDMRMPGNYNYLDADTPAIQTYRHQSPRKASTGGGIPTTVLESISYPRKDISIFLSERPDKSHNRPFPYTRNRYRGPVYTMTQPSPSSSALYIGVEGGLISFDMASTDDLVGRHADWYLQNTNLEPTDFDSSFDFSPMSLTAYERPRSTDKGDYINLLYQMFGVHSFRDLERYESDHSGCTPGVDCRWTYLHGQYLRRR